MRKAPKISSTGDSVSSSEDTRREPTPTALTNAAQTLAVVVKGYPRLSETFIAQELLGLQDRGVRFHIYSLRHPTDTTRHPVHAEITAPVTYLPEYIHHHPAAVAAAWYRARRLPGYPAAWTAFRRDVARDRTRNRFRRFAQACVLATRSAPATPMYYAHFLHTPASVARYAAIMRGVPFAVSAHAKDIWTTPDWDVREKLATCAWLTTCTRGGADHLRTLAADPARIHLTYHGLDLARFPLPVAPSNPPNRDGTAADDPVRLLSVGRLVEKKGYAILLRALARQPGHWTFDHIGGGPLAPSLRDLAVELGIAERITWHGATSQQQVLAALANADLFVLASRIAADGDRDGLPNVLVEAQSQQIACLSTTVSAIPELITDGVSGALVPPGDVDALAAALTALIAAPGERARLARAGAARVRRDFAADVGIDAIVGLLALTPPPAPPRHTAPSANADASPGATASVR